VSSPFPEPEQLWPVSPIKAFTFGADDGALWRGFMLVEFEKVSLDVRSLAGRVVVVPTWSQAVAGMLGSARRLRLWSSFVTVSGERAIVEWRLPAVSLSAPTFEEPAGGPAELRFTGEALPGPSGRWYEWRPLAVEKGARWVWV
jgi:hypothetical protein